MHAYAYAWVRVVVQLLDEELAMKLQGLAPETMMVYHEIERAGNDGVWNRDIKSSTGVPQNLLSKALKELDKRSLIKSVKSIHQKTKKIWMLYDLTPSTAITGGPWYTDNEFDHEFVNEIANLAFQEVRNGGGALWFDPVPTRPTRHSLASH